MLLSHVSDNCLIKIISGYDLEELGFSVVSEGKHYKLTYFQDPRYTIVMAKSCSDARAGNNLASEIIRKML